MRYNEGHSDRVGYGGRTVEMRKILFVTGTRADYGKIKVFIQAVEDNNDFEAFVFVSGMHLIETFGNTYKEVLKDNYKNVYVDFSQANSGVMSYDFGNVVCNLTGYVRQVKPDAIIVHGDRLDALAGAAVGALNNIKVVHIEGGELSGTIDESIRHAISKFAHIHLVSNENAKQRLMQLGEEERRIFIVGSPDIDIMMSDKLPDIVSAKKRYDIPFDTYAFFTYHPVTTEFVSLQRKIQTVVEALIDSGKNYIAIYPNNDYGSEIILNELNKLKDNPHFRIFPSIRFEYFLTLLKNAEFMVGNSSAGIRETGIYGIPAIDVGSRQTGRYTEKDIHIQHVIEDKTQLLRAIEEIPKYRSVVKNYGNGDSSKRFMEILREDTIWNMEIQKRFVDIDKTI